RVLGQLFQIAETFDMEVQPQLLLLQKNMLMAEGVSRGLDPALNIWTLTQPLIERWMRENRGPEARLRQAASDLLHAVERLPSVLTNIENSAARLADGKIRLHADSIAEFTSGRSRGDLALWALAAAGAALAGALLLAGEGKGRPSAFRTRANGGCRTRSSRCRPSGRRGRHRPRRPAGCRERSRSTDSHAPPGGAPAGHARGMPRRSAPAS